MQIRETTELSHWWRFTEYQIVEIGENSWYIRPAPGAILEAYEWLLVDSGRAPVSRQMFIGEQYQSLLDLDIGSHSAILDWCRTYGLLGILTQRTIEIALAPRWMPIFKDHWPKVLTPFQVHYIRTNTGWRKTVEHARAGLDPVIGEMNPEDVARVIERFEDHIGTLVDPSETVLQAPAAIVLPISLLLGEDVELHEVQSLEDAIGLFLPQVPAAQLEDYDYPLPLSDEFWHAYAEPLKEFQWAVGDFKNMVENLGHKDQEHWRSRNLAIRGQDQINSLLTVNPALSIGLSGSITQQWNFPSLLSLFAFEVWQELLGRKSVLHCKRPNCGKLFLSRQYNQTYCSWTCQKDEERKRHRAKNRSPSKKREAKS